MKTLFGAALLLLMPTIALGQTAKPGPEVQALGYYVGTWKGHGEAKAGPLGPAGKLSSEMTCSWFTGGFQVVCRGAEMGPTGKRAFLNILSYDRKTKTYTEYSVTDLGEAEHDQGGTLAKNKLTFLLTPAPGVKVRYTEERLSPVLLAYRTEAALGAKPWRVIAEGKIAKVK
ncbi:MAG TPA: DUF1579 family protein [Rhizomicrobium sp.]|nr:DUF1579 family protein [Rhizomicrobium sp.]